MTALSRHDSSPTKQEERPETPRVKRGAWLKGCIVAGALLLASIPHEARADIPIGGRVDLVMYGRVGAAWAIPSGPQIIQGQSMNLTGGSIGGRFEEGDYIEPRMIVHVIKPDTKDGTYVDVNITPAMYAKNGSFIGAFGNGFPAAGTLAIELFQAFVEAGNLFTPGLSIWAGAKFYRGPDVHIADYFYYNNLSSQGAGVKYKGFDAAVLVTTQAQGKSPLYNIDTDNDSKPDYDRLRTIFVAQYSQKLPFHDSSLDGLAEFHLMPAARAKPGAMEKAPLDFGGVLGAKLHIDFDKGNFNDFSVRWGNRIANGAAGGGRTFDTFGLPDPTTKTYAGGHGIELVDHFLVNVGTLLTVNGYGTLHWDKGASGKPEDKTLDFALGARTFLYAHKNFHMVNELTFQGRKDGDTPMAPKPMGTAVKFSIVPTIVPSGKLEAWARPHFRAIYTAGFYNGAALDQKMSPYLRNVNLARVAHYIGTRVEWWF